MNSLLEHLIIVLFLEKVPYNITVVIIEHKVTDLKTLSLVIKVSSVGRGYIKAHTVVYFEQNKFLNNSKTKFFNSTCKKTSFFLKKYRKNQINSTFATTFLGFHMNYSMK